MVTSGALAGGGDVLCQVAIEGVTPYDAARTARLTLLGTVLVAPLVHHWYGVLHRFLPGTTAVVVVQRVAWDQLVFSPLFLSVGVMLGWGTAIVYCSRWMSSSLHVGLVTDLVVQSLDSRRT